MTVQSPDCLNEIGTTADLLLILVRIWRKCRSNVMSLSPRRPNQFFSLVNFSTQVGPLLKVNKLFEGLNVGKFTATGGHPSAKYDIGRF